MSIHTHFMINGNNSTGKAKMIKKKKHFHISDDTGDSNNPEKTERSCDHTWETET